MTSRLAFVSAFLLLAPACTGGEDGAGPEIMTDPAGYSITVPSGWDVSGNFQDDAFIRADITRGGDMGIQVRLAEVPSGGFSAASEAMIASYTEDMSSHWGGHCLETEREIPPAGDEALTVRFRSEWENGRMWYLQFSLVRKGTMLVIFQCGCPWEDRQEGQAAFDGAVRSISFQ